MPSPRSSIAAASPDGPPPTMTGPSSIPILGLQRGGDLRSAEESLAAPHQGAGPATQAVGIHRRDRAVQCRVDLPAGDALTEADDSPEVGIAVDQPAVLIRPSSELADVRHSQVRLCTRVRELEAGLGERLSDPFGDPQGTADPG